MYIQANPYAIGPSDFHDWDYEKWSARADARDAALESFSQDWVADLVSDERGQVFTKIDEVMTTVMESICCDDRRCELLNRLLFSLWNGGQDCIRELRALLDKEMNGVMEHEFDKGTDRH